MVEEESWLPERQKIGREKASLSRTSWEKVPRRWQVFEQGSCGCLQCGEFSIDGQSGQV